MKIYIIGTGMDGSETLTAEAAEKIRSADVLIGAGRVLKPFLSCSKPVFSSWKSEEICEFIGKNHYETVAVLMSGDCGFFSGAEKLVQALKVYDTEIICGISSHVYFCSKIKIPWQDMNFISLHGANGNIIRNICRNKYCFFLLGGDITPAHICRKICEYDLKNINVYIGENLALENEKIYSGKAQDFTETMCSKLCVMITENKNYEHGFLSGISDNDFIRGDVPMTKSEVRSVVISKLNIGANDICWDVGCGTGSVSVEMALHCYNGTVFSVDKNASAIDLTIKNKYKFGCDNINVFHENAPECLIDFPAPNRVFIGGSCGKIGEIISTVYNKNPNADIVITAVSLETLEASINALKNFEIVPEVVQIAVTRTNKIDSHTMFAAENPVFIIKGVKR